ncbi:MAG TPA: DUF3971 domain-containing protein [Xanthobacteraceae bacterium]|nr:DUF3971 domain-containing protein [Xanthobacteraceae bacterium]
MAAALWRRVRPILQRPLLRRSLIGVGAVLAIIGLVFGGLWWRLGSGPIEFDMATPWLTAAIEDNFGEHYKVQVGGTQIERDEGGRIRLRLRDITVRDAEGAIAASAPKAEVGFSSRTLLTGRVRAERLALVGAEMSVRIEPGGNVTVFAGSDKRPIATASVPASSPESDPLRERDPHAGSNDPSAPKSGIENLTALLAWIDSLGASGLDGHDLVELGLKSGNLIVDDQRNGKRWDFQNIDLSLTRAKGGNVVFKVESASEEQPWLLSAAVAPLRSGRRVFTVEARRVMAKDLLLALRLGDDPIMAQVPISASLRAEIGSDGTTQALQGRIIAEAGFLTESTEPTALSIDRAEFNLEWDAMRRVLVVPFQVIAGGNRFTLFAHVEPPRARGASWNVAMAGGTVVLGMDKSGGPLVFNSIKVRARIDPKERRLILEQGDIANAEIGVALTGEVDFSTGDPRLAFGIAGTRMQLAAMKKLWPAFVQPQVRSWVEEHILRGDIERVAIATNAHLSAFKRGGPPVPDDGLFIEIVARNAVLRPLETLPPIEDAEVAVRVTGRYASVGVNKGTVALPSGRKLAVANGLFEVPDSEVPQPPTKTRMRIEGPVPAVAELLATERLREFVEMPFDISSAKGNVFGQVSLAFPLKRDLPPGSSTYSVVADIANFSVDNMIMGQKVEAQSLRINAGNQGYQIKGDTKIAGAAATLDYRKLKTDNDAEVRIQTSLDEAGRSRFGLDVGNVVVGSVPVKLTGYIGQSEKDSRFIIDADLTPARIDNLLPGWTKPAGKTARANFALVTRGQSTRIEDMVIEGSGTQVKGIIELDGSRDIVAAHFPVFSLAEGDRATFKADRAPDGTLRVTMRGDVHDGRGFIKSAVSGARPEVKDKPPIDLDLDLRLGTVVGFNGETLRNLELKLSRRAGQIRSFGMNAKLGRDAQLGGDLRRKPAGGNVLYFETRDAGALFRFTDSYARMNGGRMWVAMDAPTGVPGPQEGLLAISEFSIRGEPALDRVVSGAPANGGQRDGVKFTRMRAEFTRMPGRLEIRDGVVQGNIGATIDGQIDYVSDEVHLRGSFVPLYQLNNMLGQIPIVGLFLGGGNEGLLGVTYEVVGPPNAPRLNVNPLSAVAPGLLRKLFEFRNAPSDRGYEALR